MSTTVGPYSGTPYKIQRQQANIRERKRMLRSAPNGYHLFTIQIANIINFKHFKKFLFFLFDFQQYKFSFR